MSDYQRILVPTDMSDFSVEAVRYASLLQGWLGSRVTLLYADETHFPIDVLDTPLGYYLDEAPQEKAELQERLRRFAVDHMRGADEVLIVQDTPARAIVRTAKEMRADLIIMGTHGRTGWRRALLGSVTENVLHETDCPVLTVTPQALASRETIDIRNIVCPVNFTYVAREALRHACSLALSFGAELRIVYVAEGVDAPRLREVEEAFRIWVDPEVRDRARYQLSVVSEGEPAERVLRLAGDVKTDLIVLGAQHKFFSDATVIGTTTERITRFARCPVLTIARKARKEIAAAEQEARLVAV
jgi:nucleotide-binding universal stress UspA family protein